MLHVCASGGGVIVCRYDTIKCELQLELERKHAVYILFLACHLTKEFFHEESYSSTLDS